jgi:hypothetical protein
MNVPRESSSSEEDKVYPRSILLTKRYLDVAAAAAEADVVARIAGYNVNEPPLRRLLSVKNKGRRIEACSEL